MIAALTHTMFRPVFLPVLPRGTLNGRTIVLNLKSDVQIKIVLHTRI